MAEKLKQYLETKIEGSHGMLTLLIVQPIKAAGI